VVLLDGANRALPRFAPGKNLLSAIDLERLIAYSRSILIGNYTLMIHRS